MPVPPDKVPEGLSPEEYARLVTVYTLMGCQNQAFEASVRAASQGAAPPVEAAEEQLISAHEMGQDLAKTMLEAAFRECGADEDADGAPEPLDTARSQLRAMGVPEEEIDKCMDILSGILSSLHEAPPKDVPDDLSAEEYFRLGMRYKDVGWTEQARDALQYAIERDPQGPVGKQALTYLRSKVPRHPVPMMAVEQNIAGFNQMAAGDLKEARSTFENLNEVYPDFEWPFGNLGTLLLQTGEIDAAKAALKKALTINPHYLNAWMHLARVHAVNSDFDKSLECLDRAEEIDSSESAIQQVRDLVELLKSQS